LKGKIIGMSDKATSTQKLNSLELG